MQNLRLGVLIILLAVTSYNCHAQWVNTEIGLDSSQAFISANGTFFHNNGPGFEFPTNSDKYMFNYASIWLFGVAGSEVYGSMNISPKNEEFWPGPLDTITGLPTDPQEWNKVWRVTKTQIDYHKEHFQDVDYVPQSAISGWPANENATNVRPVLAPFVDWNDDGFYNPMDGDYPSVLGEDNLYFICNDAAGEHLTSGSKKMGVELFGSMFTKATSASSNTVYLTLYVLNASNNSYDDFRIGLFNNFELGNPNDNFCGTDVPLNLIYGYNGDNDDDGQNGYGNNLPAAGCIFLNTKLASSQAFSSTDTTRYIPANSTEYSNVMHGNWRTGRGMLSSGNGTQSGNETKYQYHAGSDIKNASSIWTDDESNDGPGIRNILGVSEMGSLPNGSFVRLDAAFFGLTASDNLRVEALLKAEDTKREFDRFSSSPIIGFNSDLSLYPNPLIAGQSIHLSSNDHAIEGVKLFDATGRFIRSEDYQEKNSKKVKFECNENLQPGIYFLNITVNGYSSSKKIIIQRL